MAFSSSSSSLPKLLQLSTIPTPMTAPISTPSRGQHPPTRQPRFKRKQQRPDPPPTPPHANCSSDSNLEPDFTYADLPDFDGLPLWPDEPDPAAPEQGDAASEAVLPAMRETGVRRRWSRARLDAHVHTTIAPRPKRELIAVKSPRPDQRPDDHAAGSPDDRLQSARTGADVDVDVRVRMGREARRAKAGTALARSPNRWWSSLLGGEGEREGLVVGGPGTEGEGWMAWAGRDRLGRMRGGARG